MLQAFPVYRFCFTDGRWGYSFWSGGATVWSCRATAAALPATATVQREFLTTRTNKQDLGKTGISNVPRRIAHVST